MKNANLPAMPTIGTISRNTKEFQETQVGNDDFMLFGITKREDLAMRLFSINAETLTDNFRPQHYQHAASVCIDLADALLKELERTECQD